MKLNLDYYKDDLLYNECEDEKQIIDQYINCYEETEFEEVLQNNDIDLNKFNALTEIRRNIISWYPFKENANILEIGSNLGQITGELCKNAKRVVSVEFSKQRGEAIAKRHKDKENLEIIVGNLQDIKFNEKFDYIILIGIIEYSNEIYKTDNSLIDLLKFVKNLLKENGHLLIATDNKFGMRNWSNIVINEDNIRYDAISTDKLKSKNQIYSKAKLEEIFDSIDIGQRKYYYPLPDYKLTSVIFTDKHLPNEEKILRSIPIYDKKDIINFNENSAYIQLLKRNKNIFPFFANSFFIDISNVLEDNEIEFVSFGNMRKSKYRLKTIIRKDEVYKLATNEESKKHIEDIKKNIDILKQHDINILDSYDNQKIISKYVKKEKTYDEVILDEFKVNGISGVLNKIEEFKKDVIDKFKTSSWDNNIFDKYEIKYDKNEIKKLNFLETGLWDLTFQNSFYIDNKLYFYDQEWRNSNIPLEFILYRNIEYLDTLKRRLNMQDIYDKLKLTSYLDIFKKLDDKLQEELRDETVFSMYIKPMKTVKGLVIENGNIRKDLDDTIGNTMRKLLEAYSTFNYNKGIEEVTRNKNILEKVENEDIKQYFENFMYRLILNNESHTFDETRSLDFYDFISRDEKIKTARSILILLNILDNTHLKSYLDSEDYIKELKTWENEIIPKKTIAN